jgi:DNA-binding transcriptional LysR family regulator
MELLQLKYFCDAAVSENFSETARKFFVPPSGISQSIGRLERELGCALFLHSGNKIRLNEEGRIFYRSASAALMLLAEGAEAVREREGAVGGELDIVCACSRSTVARAIERFTALYPEVNLLLRNEPPKKEDCDVLIAEDCPFPYRKRELILDERICLAMPAGHPLAACASISVSSLAGERFISMPEKSSLYEITAKACTTAGFVPNIAIRLDDPFYIRKYVELGLGVAFVPEISWAGLFSGGVVLRPLVGLRRRAYAYLPAGRQEKQAGLKFLDVLCAVHGE